MEMEGIDALQGLYCPEEALLDIALPCARINELRTRSAPWAFGQG
jgi:hypothetical protein